MHVHTHTYIYIWYMIYNFATHGGDTPGDPGLSAKDHNRETTRKWETASECFETLLNRKGLASFLKLEISIWTSNLQYHRKWTKMYEHKCQICMKPYEIKSNHGSANFSTKPKTYHKI